MTPLYGHAGENKQFAESLKCLMDAWDKMSEMERDAFAKLSIEYALALGPINEVQP